MRRSLLALAFLVGCTSLGQGGRAVPKVAKEAPTMREVGIDGDDNELALAIERELERRGVKVTLLSTPKVREQRGDKEYRYDEVQTRYVIRVRSVDGDRCIPEGSTQMDFYVSVTDFTERNRLFLASGENSCKGTIVKNFAAWLDGKREVQ